MQSFIINIPDEKVDFFLELAEMLDFEVLEMEEGDEYEIIEADETDEEEDRPQRADKKDKTGKSQTAASKQASDEANQEDPFLD